MSQDNLKTLTIKISNESLKKLKVLAIQKELPLAIYAREYLEKSLSKKNIFGQQNEAGE